MEMKVTSLKFLEPSFLICIFFENLNQDNVD